MRDDRARLQDVLDAIERIAERTVQGRSTFEQDELVQVWVLHHLQIVGEAVRGISDRLRRETPGIPWSKIVGMRNILVHHYFDIDVDAVWGVVERDLPELKRQIEEVIVRL